MSIFLEQNVFRLQIPVDNSYERASKSIKLEKVDCSNGSHFIYIFYLQYEHAQNLEAKYYIWTQKGEKEHKENSFCLDTPPALS